MGRDKHRFAFAAICMLLVLGALGVGFYAYVAADRYAAREVIFIAPLGGGYFETERENISFVSRGREQVARGDRQVTASIIFCGAEHFGIYAMNFLEGAPWHETESDTPVIILNEALAWYLFGGGNIVGLTVEVGGGLHRILGVVRQEGEPYMAWMPRKQQPSVTAIYLRAYPFNRADARAEAVRLVHSLGVYRLTGYVIVDVGTYIESIGVRHRLLLYTVWLCVLTALLITMRRYNVRVWVHIFVGAAVGMYVLTGIHDIIIGLPNLAAPDVSVFSYLTNAGVLPPEVYLSYGMRRLSLWNSYANYALMVGLLGLVGTWAALPMRR